MATAEFSKFAGILSAALSQHHLSSFVTLTKYSNLTGPQSFGWWLPLREEYITDSEGTSRPAGVPSNVKSLIYICVNNILPLES